MDNGIEIEQYIVGTGGTKLDDALVEPSVTEYTYENNIKYTINICDKKHGFLECDINPQSDPVFEFIESKSFTPKIIKSKSTSKPRSKSKRSKSKRSKSKRSKSKRSTKKHL